jgi:hypothetical protein
MEYSYAFIPYPVELADFERRGLLPRATTRILGLRRFADPVTGEWVTTTEEVTDLVGSGRSTAQKHLRWLEAEGFLHLSHVRSRTVQLAVSFGGFTQPPYRAVGKPPLRWDAEYVSDGKRMSHAFSARGAVQHENVSSRTKVLRNNPRKRDRDSSNQQQAIYAAGSWSFFDCH